MWSNPSNEGNQTSGATIDHTRAGVSRRPLTALGNWDKIRSNPIPASRHQNGIACSQCFIPPKIGTEGIAMINSGTKAFRISSQPSKGSSPGENFCVGVMSVFNPENLEKMTGR